MKKLTILLLILGMVATPCLAQEVESDGFFSIDGTRWNVFFLSIEIGILNEKPYFPPPEYYNDSIGFYKGTVYSCDENDCRLVNNMSYIDTPVVSIAYSNPIHDKLCIMQPTGVGVLISWGYRARSIGGPNPVDYQAVVYSIGIMFKVDNKWIPPEVE